MSSPTDSLVESVGEGGGKKISTAEIRLLALALALMLALVGVGVAHSQRYWLPWTPINIRDKFLARGLFLPETHQNVKPNRSLTSNLWGLEMMANTL